MKAQVPTSPPSGNPFLLTEVSQYQALDLQGSHPPFEEAWRAPAEVLVGILLENSGLKHGCQDISLAPPQTNQPTLRHFPLFNVVPPK